MTKYFFSHKSLNFKSYVYFVLHLYHIFFCSSILFFTDELPSSPTSGQDFFLSFFMRTCAAQHHESMSVLFIQCIRFFFSSSFDALFYYCSSIDLIRPPSCCPLFVFYSPVEESLIEK